LNINVTPKIHHIYEKKIWVGADRGIIGFEQFSEVLIKCGSSFTYEVATEAAGVKYEKAGVFVFSFAYDNVYMIGKSIYYKDIDGVFEGAGAEVIDVAEFGGLTPGLGIAWSATWCLKNWYDVGIEAGIHNDIRDIGIFLKYKLQNLFCTNNPVIYARFTYPYIVKQSLSPTYNIENGYFISRFNLPHPRSSYTPQYIDFYINDVKIEKLENIIPVGHQIFRFDPSILNYADRGSATNEIILRKIRANSGHYIQLSNMQVFLPMKKMGIYVVASNQIEANEIIKEMSSALSNRAELGIYSEDIRSSNPNPIADEEISIYTTIFNLGTNGALFASLQFLDNGVQIGENISLGYVPSMDSIPVNITWNPTAGTHNVTVRINPDGRIQESDYSNNEASKIITVGSAPDTTPPIINTVTLSTTTPNAGEDILVTVNATDNFAVTAVTANGIALTPQIANNWTGTITAIEGTHPVNVSARDAAGNVGWDNSTSYTATMLDTIPPASITSLSPTAGESWINWTWTNPSDPDFNHTIIYMDGMHVANVSESFYNATNLLPDTVHEISTHTVDKIGNVNETWVNASARTAALPDTTPPASITELQNISYAQNYINWTWMNPLDTDFNHTMIYLDGIHVANVSEQFYNATNLLPDTVHEISTHTVDKIGNVNETWVNASARTAALPDTTPPASITELKNITYAQTSINWTWTNPDDIDFSRVMVYLDGVFQTNVTLPINYYNATDLTADVEYTISTHTVDLSGNTNQTWINHTARTAPLPDITPPASVTDLQNVTRTQTSINWTWQNPSDFDFNYTVVYTDGLWKVNTSKNYYNLTGLLPNTPHTISTRTVDINGNINLSWVNDTATTLPVPDTVLPIITIISPVNDTTYNIDSVDLNYSVNEPTAWEGYSLDTGTSIILYGNTTLTGLIDGLHTLTIYANDTSGNMNSSMVCFMIDTTPPSIISVTLNNTLVKFGAPIEVTVNATDENGIDTVTADGIPLTLTGGYYVGTITADTSPVTVNVTDEIGNMATDTSATYTTDDTPPVINTVTLNITTPKIGEDILVTVNATDNFAVTSVEANGIALTHQLGNNWTGTITAIEGTHPVNVSARDAAGNVGWDNSTSYIATTLDTTPPAGVTNIYSTAGESWINWTWTNPSDPDFNHTIIYMNGSFAASISETYYNATGLLQGTLHSIGTRTVDLSGNMNETWVNDTAMTNGELSGDFSIKISKPSIYSFYPVGETVEFNAAVTDQIGNPVTSGISAYADLSGPDSTSRRVILSEDAGNFVGEYTVKGEDARGIWTVNLNAFNATSSGQASLQLFFTGAYFIQPYTDSRSYLLGETANFTAKVVKPVGSSQPLTDKNLSLNLSVYPFNTSTPVIDSIEMEFNDTSNLFYGSIDTGSIGPGLFNIVFKGNDTSGNFETAELFIGVSEDFTIEMDTEKASYDRDEAVNISGIVKYLNNSPLENISVNLKIDLHGFKRSYSVTTNETGHFNYSFHPFDTEAGKYSIRAEASNLGLLRFAERNFTILGLYLVPQSAKIEMVEDSTRNINFTLYNLGDTTITGISASVNDLDISDKVTVTIDTVPSELQPYQSTSIKIQIKAETTVPDTAKFNIEITSDQNSNEISELNVKLFKPDPILRVYPAEVITGLNKNQTRIETVAIYNMGYGVLRNVTLHQPENNWMSITSNTSIGDLLPGENTTFDIHINSYNVDAGIYEGSVNITSDNHHEVQVNVTAFVTELTNGSLLFHVSDALERNLSNANISLINQDTYDEFASSTNSTGYALMTDLPAGRYIFEVSSDATNTLPQMGNVEVEPMDTPKLIEIALYMSFIDFDWEVTPTSIEDYYNVILRMRFETDVPIPLLLAFPPNIEYNMAPGEEKTGTFTLYNVGLVSIYNVTISPIKYNGIILDPLITDVGEIKGKSNIQIPYKIKLASNVANCQELSGNINIRGRYLHFINNHEVISYIGTTVPVLVKTPFDETCKIELDIPIPNFCFNIDGYKFGTQTENLSVDPSTIWFLTGEWGNLIENNSLVLTDVSTATNNNEIGDIQMTDPIGITFSFGLSDIISLYNPTIRLGVDIIGDGLDIPFFNGIWQGDFEYNQIAPSKSSNLDLKRLTTGVGVTLPELIGGGLVFQFGNTTCYNCFWILPMGGLDASLPRPGGLPNITIYIPQVHLVGGGSIGGGTFCWNCFPDVFIVPTLPHFGGTTYVPWDWPEWIWNVPYSDPIRPKPKPKVTQTIHEVVELSISQNVTMERDAFWAGLGIRNRMPDKNINNVRVILQIKGNGGLANDKFFIQEPRLKGINNLDGSGVISPSALAKAQWLMIPKPGAGGANVEGTKYNISANISYSVDGVNFEISTQEVEILVKPQPEIVLDYFIPSDVIANKPFKLAVKATNEGYGPARNFSIETAQPVIYYNPSGLLIDFEIIRSQLQGQERSTSLKVDFGNIEPAENKLAWWDMVTSIDGTFTEFTGEYTHTSELGGMETSLIKKINTYIIQKQMGTGEIGYDFLANSESNETQYVLFNSSTGNSTFVSNANYAVVNMPTPENPVLDISIEDYTGEWVIVSIEDPYNNLEPIGRVVRTNDGTEIPSYNYWMRNGRILIVDHYTEGFDGKYTIIYENQEFIFVHLTDVHIGWCGAPEECAQVGLGYLVGNYIVGKTIEEIQIDESMVKFADIIAEFEGYSTNHKKPKFILITGDIVNWNDKIFFDKFSEVLATTKIPVYIVPGNHDRREFIFLGDDKLDHFVKYVPKLSGHDIPFINKEYGYADFMEEDYQFVGLDSGADYDPFTDKDMTPEGSGLNEDQMTYLESLDQSQNKIIFIHSPVIDSTDDSFDSSCYLDVPYYGMVNRCINNPVDSNDIYGKNDATLASNRQDLIDYSIQNNVQLILSGHTHKDEVFKSTGESVNINDPSRPLFIQTNAVTNRIYRPIEISGPDATPLQTIPIPSKPKFTFKGYSPIDMHVYDSHGKHTGVNVSDSIDRNIPLSFYFSEYKDENVTLPQMIMLYNTSDEYRVEIISNFSKQKVTKSIDSFNFTIGKQASDAITNFHYYNVSILENTTARISVNWTTSDYLMDIDDDGDNVFDHIKYPDYIEVNYAPTAIINSPVNNSMWDQGALILFNGSGTDIEDGTLVNFSLWHSDIDGVIGHDNEFNDSNISAGKHNITFIITDSAGLTSTQKIIITINDTKSPTLSVDYPSDGKFFANENLIVRGTAYDDSSIANVTVNGIESGKEKWNANPILSEGTNSIKIVATDNTGFNTTKVITVYYNKSLANDTIPPASILNLQNITATNSARQSWINWTWNNPNDSDFSHVLIYVNDMWMGNTSLYYFNMTGIYPNSTYTISIRTADLMDNINVTWVNSTVRTFNLVDSQSPANVKNLDVKEIGNTWLNFTWLNPPDPDFNHTILYLNGAFLTNVPAPQNYYNITGLTPYTEYELGTQTADTSGNINTTWVNATARTLAAPDSAPPVITNVSAVPGTDSAVITWDTDEASDSLVKYGTTTGNYPLSLSDSGMTTSHSITLTSLTPDTLYYYVVNSTDEVGSSNESAELTFMTLASADTTPPTIESVTLDAYTTIANATIHVTVNAADNIGVTSVTADGIALAQDGNNWSGNLKVPSTAAPGTYSAAINASDAAGNAAESAVTYTVVTPQGGVGVDLIPTDAEVPSGSSITITVKVTNTENFDDTFNVELTYDDIPDEYNDYKLNFAWTDWPDHRQTVQIKAKSSVEIPLTITVPSGESDYKIYSVTARSTNWITVGGNTGGFLII